MANTPTLRFGEFDGEWSEKKLKDYILKYKGGAPLKPKDFVKYSQYEVIPKKAIQKGGRLLLDKINATYCSEDFFNNNQNNVIDNSYLVTTLRDLVPSGPSIGLIVQNNNKNHLLLAQGVYGFQVSDSLNQEFLIQLSNRIEYRRLMQKIMVGSTQVHIRNQEYFGIKLNLPTKPEQQKIATFLTAIDSSIEQLSKKEQLLRSYKKGVMQKIFSREIRFKCDDGGVFEDWIEKRLGDVFNFLRGSSLSKSDMTTNGITKCIHYGELFTTYKEKIETIKSSTNLIDGQLSKIGDILMPSSDVTPQGLATASVLLEGNIIIGGDINILRPKQDIDSLFVSYFLNSNKSEIMKLVTGTTVKHIYNKDVSKLIINLPSLPEQTKIANFLSSLDKQIAQVSEQLAEKKDFKKGLLQKMFV